MTNLEFIKTLKSGEEIFNFLEHNHHGCTQYNSEIWKNTVCQKSTEGTADVKNVELSSGIKKLKEMESE